MKVNWSALRNNIPSKLRTKARTSYDVLWQDDLMDKSGTPLFGLTNFDPSQIVLDTKQSDKETIHTIFHEFLHSIDDSYEVGLTEKQVRKLEKSFLYVREFFLKLEGIE